MLAYHWSAAHDLPRALGADVEAGRQAATAYGYAEAAQHLERALVIWPRVPDPEAHAGIDLSELLELAATARAREPSLERALALLDEALSLVDRDREPVRAAVLLTKRGRLRRDIVEDKAYDDLNEAVALLPVGAPERPSVLATIAAAGLVLTNCDFPLVRRLATEAADAARALGDMHSLADALATLGPALVYMGDREEGAAVLREAVALADATADDDVMLRALINLSDVLCGMGQAEEGAEVARRGMDFARRVGMMRREGVFVGANLAEALMALAQWDEA